MSSAPPESDDRGGSDGIDEPGKSKTRVDPLAFGKEQGTSAARSFD